MVANVSHPIPYQGSKRSLARQIIKYIPSNTKRLVEPFAGSAAVSLAVAYYKKASSFWLNDLNEPLVKLWSCIINQPEAIASAYKELWEEQAGQERTYYNYVRERFNRTQKPEYLLYQISRKAPAFRHGDIRLAFPKNNLALDSSTLYNPRCEAD